MWYKTNGHQILCCTDLYSVCVYIHVCIHTRTDTRTHSQPHTSTMPLEAYGLARFATETHSPQENLNFFSHWSCLMSADIGSLTANISDSLITPLGDVLSLAEWTTQRRYTFLGGSRHRKWTEHSVHHVYAGSFNEHSNRLHPLFSLIDLQILFLQL